MNNPVTPSPIYIPQNTQGRPITINAAPFVFQAGMTVVVIFKQAGGSNLFVPKEVEITASFTPGQSVATYATVGGEFQSVPGLCDAQLKVTGSGMLDYSLILPRYVFFQAPLG